MVILKNTILMINFHHIDNMLFMKDKPDNFYDLAIVDPPYGININPNMGIKKGQRKRHSKRVDWDSSIPPPEYFNELFRVSENQIIWGGNYFNLPANKHFIFWDKRTPVGMSFSDGEYAWTSFNRANRKFTRRNITLNKIHPTEKPIQLYRWLLVNYAKQGDRILDTHGGSMSIAIAADMEGFDLDICDIDKEYFDLGVKRYNQFKQQKTLF